MKKFTGLLYVALAFLFLTGNAMAFPGQASFVGTTWSGTVNVITPESTTPTTATITLVFTAESSKFLTGMIAGLAPQPIPFSAIREGRSLELTAVNLKVSAEKTRFNRWGGVLEVHGSDFSDGSTFEGFLSKQAAVAAQ